MTKTLFSSKHIDTREEPYFFGSRSTLRTDIETDKFIVGRYEKLMGQIWFPQDYSYSNDAKQFSLMSDSLKELFMKNLRSQTAGDSLATRAVTESFLPIVSDPNCEKYFMLYAFTESIHSQSYADLVKALPVDAEKEFDKITDIEELMARVKIMVEPQNELIISNAYGVLNTERNGNIIHRQSLLEALASIIVLEGIAFQSSFITSFAFGEEGLMSESVKVISKIKEDKHNCPFCQ